MKQIFAMLIFLGAANFAFATPDQTLNQPHSNSTSQVAAGSAVTGEFSSARRGSYFDWGQAVNGWGYCYEWTNNGYVLNNGNPVGNWYCEQHHSSFFDWGQAVNGYYYCYQYTPYGIAMNEGQPVSDYYCR